MHKVYLVPGFFGFSQLGSLSYFHRVDDVLGAALRERGLDADVVELSTAPTASIRRRAITVLRDVQQTGGLTADSISFVGHSTGGLDVRLLLSPGVRLVAGDDEEVGSGIPR
jgi:triacylglycerol esterase/lipase EstA (alpha/beta hydrolase family)